MARSLRAISFEGGMILRLDITAIRPAEIPFAFDQDEQLDSRSGCIGRLQGDFGSGREFYPEWVDHQAKFKTHDFGVELNKVVHALRAKGGCGLLADRHRMAEFCVRHPETALGTGYAAVHGVKLKTVSRTYLLRCDPRKGETNFCLYAYETPLLAHCVEQLARQRPVPAGTRFREEARYNKVSLPYSLRKIHTMKTVKKLPDGRTEVETVINGCNVTVVFAKDDNSETMKNVTDLIMSAYAERKAREAQE